MNKILATLLAASSAALILAGCSSLHAMVSQSYKDGYKAGVWGAHNMNVGNPSLLSRGAVICLNMETLAQNSSDQKNDDFNEWQQGCDDATKQILGG